ncbi:MAG TPA: hypothetical protein VFX00_01965 [Pedococcus sp.]|jgi:hypothetical protein|nr:hypothetical protein [Pedococcus sp.]
MLYAALWRSLPGPPWVRVLVCLVLFAAVVAACFLWLFPWVAPLMPFNDNTVGPHASGHHAAYERHWS